MPLDERAMLSVRRDGVEPPQLGSGWVTATWARQCPADACCFSSSTGGSRTHNHGHLKSVALPVGVPCLVFICKHRMSDCVPIPFSNQTTNDHQIEKASPMGFEPTVSCVTGRRALRCSTRTYFLFPYVSTCLECQLKIDARHTCPCFRVRSTQSRNRTCKPSGLSRAALPVGVSGRLFLCYRLRPSSSLIGRRSQLLPGWNRTIVSWM